jgi:putative peptidoglycan lipid II flippase
MADPWPGARDRFLTARTRACREFLQPPARVETPQVSETLRSSGQVSLAVAASRVLGVVRESTFAALFGGGALADAYQVAFRIPNLLRDLFAEGALSSAFVPTFTAVLEKEGEDAALALARLVSTAILLITGALTLAGIVWAEPLVWLISAGFGENTAKAQLAVELTRMMMPFLAVVSLGAVWMGMLNARRRWLAPAWAPAVFNLVNIAAGFGLVAAGLDERTALWWWSLATLAAAIVQTLVQVPALWKLGWRPGVRVRGLFTDPGVRRIATLMAPAVLGLAAVQINLFFNTRFASSLGDGPVAQLVYAFRIFYLPVGVFTVALATVTTTRVSEHAAKGDLAGLSSATGEAVSAVWMLMTASTVGLVVLAEPIVGVLYERGAFTAADTRATAMVLQAYALGLLPYGLVKVFAPVFYGLDRPHVALFGSLAAVAVNLGFSAATWQILGAPGLALGTALGALVNVTVLRLGFSRHAGVLERPVGVMRGLLALLLANAVMGALVGLVWWLGVAPWLGTARGFMHFVLLAGGLAAVVMIGFASFVAVLRAFDYPGSALLASLPRKVWSRVTRRRSK